MWSHVKLSEIKWSQVKSSKIKWSQMKLGEFRWSQEKSSEVKSSDLQSYTPVHRPLTKAPKGGNESVSFRCRWAFTGRWLSKLSRCDVQAQSCPFVAASAEVAGGMQMHIHMPHRPLALNCPRFDFPSDDVASFGSKTNNHFTEPTLLSSRLTRGFVWFSTTFYSRVYVCTGTLCQS